MFKDFNFRIIWEYMPFFLEGIAGDDRYNQPDGIHPTSEGYRIIADTVYPYVLEAIKQLSENR